MCGCVTLRLSLRRSLRRCRNAHSDRVTDTVTHHCDCDTVCVTVAVTATVPLFKRTQQHSEIDVCLRHYVKTTVAHPTRLLSREGLTRDEVDDSRTEAHVRPMRSKALTDTLVFDGTYSGEAMKVCGGALLAVTLRVERAGGVVSVAADIEALAECTELLWQLNAISRACFRRWRGCQTKPYSAALTATRSSTSR